MASSGELDTTIIAAPPDYAFVRVPGGSSIKIQTGMTAEEVKKKIDPIGGGKGILYSEMFPRPFPALKESDRVTEGYYRYTPIYSAPSCIIC